jgi:hypothetical protein
MKNIFLSNEPFFSVLALIPCRRIRVIYPELDPRPREISPGEKTRKIA